jgi:hypothetical protein
MISPGYWGAHQIAFEKAVFNKEAFTVATDILVWNVIRGIIVSIITGFITAMIAGENSASTMVLGVLLLLFGLYIVFVTWTMIPVWYHVVFSLMLIPMTILGGRLKSFAAASAP